MHKKIIQNIVFIIRQGKEELHSIFSDSAVLFSYIGATLLVGFLYSYIYSHESITDLPIVVVDHDQSLLSRQVIRMVDATQQVNVKYSEPNLLSAKYLFDHGKVRGILVIPEEFSKNIQKGMQAHISVYCDASYILYYKQFLTATTTAVGTFSAQVEVIKIMATGIPQEQAVNIRRPVEAIAKPLFNIDGGYATFLMPVVFLIAIQTMQITAMGILGGTRNERKIQLQSSMQKNILALLGSSLAYIFVSLLLILIQLTIIIPIFNFPERGNFLSTILFLFPFLLSVTFLGMFLNNFFKYREDATMIVTLSSIPALFLCGVSWPSIAFPEWIKLFSFFIPSTLGVKGFVEITQFGTSLNEIKFLWGKLWLLSLFYFLLMIFSMYYKQNLQKKKRIKDSRNE